MPADPTSTDAAMDPTSEGQACSLSSLLSLIKARRSVRGFDPDRPVSPEILDQLVEAAIWAPSGYNLQPTHLVLVSDAARRAELVKACMGQKSVAQAPVVAVFVGDRNVAEHHLELIIEADRKVGGINEQYEGFLRKYVGIGFGCGPAGLGRLFKAAVFPVLRWFTPIPSLPAVDRRYWLAKQACLAAMNFMLAVKAAGLESCPMEGFDDRSMARVLNLPTCMTPILVVPIGYARPDAPKQSKSRLPRSRLVHLEQWQEPGR